MKVAINILLPNELHITLYIQNSIKTTHKGAIHGVLGFYVVMFFPAVIFIEKFGMRISFIAAIALSLIGSWIALTVQNKGAQVFGQLLIDCGFPLVASAVTKVPAQWFPFKERFYATSVGIMAGMFGYALGDTTEAIFGKENAINFAITLTVIGGVIITLLVLFYQDTPNEPPSVSQAQKEGSHLELKGDLAILLKDTAFLLATISTALYICFTIDVSKGLANIIKLGDIDIQDIEGITIFFYVPGIISIMLPAFFLGRGIMLYRTVYLIVEIVAFVAVGILVVAIAYASENQQFLYISSIVNGFIMSMNMPLAYEIVAEQGYPFSEALTAGAVHAFYALFRLILKGLNRVLDEDNAGIASTAYCFVLIVLVFLSFILMFFAKIKHRRLKMELKADK